MKKIIIIITAAVLVIAAAVGFVLYNYFTSPEYAMYQIIRDVKKEGIDGLEPHLTGDAEEAVKLVSDLLDQVTEFTDDNLIVSYIASLLNIDKYVQQLLAELDKVEWHVGDILKSSERTNVYVEFNYEDKLVGSVLITMVQRDGSWKISKLGIPDFDKINF